MSISLTKLSPNGQVVIPADIRREAGLNAATKFIVFAKGGDILLKQLHGKELADDVELMQRLARSEKDIQSGKYVSVEADVDLDQLDKKLINQK